MPIISNNGLVLEAIQSNNLDLDKVYAKYESDSERVLVFQKHTIRAKVKFICNWKGSNNVGTKDSITNFFTTLETSLDYDDGKKLIIFPQPCFLKYTKDAIPALISPMCDVGCQWISSHEKGAYTGQVSATMVSGCGANSALIGEEETRDNLGVTDSICADMVGEALRSGLDVYIFIPETQTEYEAGSTETIITSHLNAIIGLNTVGASLIMDNVYKINLVYQPRFDLAQYFVQHSSIAISHTGEVVNYIHSWLEERYGNEVAENVSYLYGVAAAPSRIGMMNEMLGTIPLLNGFYVAGQSTSASNLATLVNGVTK